MLAEMECPALVLWGAESHLLGRGLERQVEEAIPRIRTIVVPDTTHFLPQERPGEVARLAEEFLLDGLTEPAGA
jgi:pimeloyl-ACP methyl ester carboxylesterase